MSSKGATGSNAHSWCQWMLHLISGGSQFGAGFSSRGWSETWRSLKVRPFLCCSFFLSIPLISAAQLQRYVLWRLALSTCTHLSGTAYTDPISAITHNYTEDRAHRVTSSVVYSMNFKNSQLWQYPNLEIVNCDNMLIWKYSIVFTEYE